MAAARKDVEARITAINRRMQELADAEAKRERKRASLSAEVESLRIAAEEEFTRRCDLEQALRKAASLFKRELFEKGEEVAALQVRHHRVLCSAYTTPRFRMEREAVSLL